MSREKDLKVFKLIDEVQILVDEVRVLIEGKKQEARPQKKIIDMSQCADGVFVSSGIGDENSEVFLFNRARHRPDSVKLDTEHWQAWRGGECPLPDGVMVEVMRHHMGGSGGGLAKIYTWTWSKSSTNLSDITQFRVIGLADGYRYAWESDK